MELRVKGPNVTPGYFKRPDLTKKAFDEEGMSGVFDKLMPLIRRIDSFVPFPGLSLLAINTPGHEVDHVCYYMRKEKVLFTGDTILGSSSSTVRDLSDYMKSLHKLSRYSLDVICPAHGALVEGPRASRLIPWYIKHREEREKQVLLAVSNGVSDVDQMVKQIYPRNLKKALRRAAAGNVRTHLDKLVKDGTVEEKPVSYTLKG